MREGIGVKKFHHYVRHDGHVEMEIWVYDEHDIRVRYPMYVSLRQNPNIAVKYDQLDQAAQFLLAIDRRECLRFLLQWYSHDETITPRSKAIEFEMLSGNELFQDIYKETCEGEFDYD